MTLAELRTQNAERRTIVVDSVVSIWRMGRLGFGLRKRCITLESFALEYGRNSTSLHI